MNPAGGQFGGQIGGQPEQTSGQPNQSGGQGGRIGNVGKNIASGAGNVGKEAGKQVAKQAGKQIGKKLTRDAAKIGAKTAGKAIFAAIAPVLPYIIAGILAVIIIIVLTSLVQDYITTTANEIKDAFAEAFPKKDSSSSTTTAGSSSMVEAAKKVHEIIENGYTYANNNSYETVEESESAGMKTVDCSTYVDWVLHEVGLDIQNRYCPNLQAELDSASFCERIDQTQVQAGDIVLFYGHVQIYGGDGVDEQWYNAGSDSSIANPAPSGWGTPFSGGGGAGNLVGIYRVKI